MTVFYEIVEYEHQSHPEWTVKVWWREREDKAGYSVWVPGAIEWGLFVPLEMREELEVLLSYGKVSAAGQSAHDLRVPRFRPMTSRLTRQLALRPGRLEMPLP